MSTGFADRFFNEHIDFLRSSDVSQLFKQAEQLTAFILEKLHVNADSELVLSYCGVPEMSRLHLEWMGIEGPTDVISIPMDELRPQSPQAAVLGDVILCPPIARLQAERQGHSVEDELLLLQTHGMLHLLGFDHRSGGEKTKMFTLQEKLLTQFLGRAAPVATEDTTVIDGFMGNGEEEQLFF